MSFISNPNDTGMKAIDLYDTPIDLRPVPKPDPVADAIEYLRANGDHYGVRLLTDWVRE